MITKTLSTEDRYCPHCYRDSLVVSFNQYSMVSDYQCLDCRKYFNKGDTLIKSDVRDLKLKTILKK